MHKEKSQKREKKGVGVTWPGFEKKKKRNCWFHVCCRWCLNQAKRITCSPVGTSASLAAHSDVEHFVSMAVQRDVVLSSCLRCGTVGWILLNSLPSPRTDVESSGV